MNFLVDAVLLLVMSSMVATGLVMRFILPPGTGGRGGHGGGKTLLDLGRHDWGDVHFWLAMAVAVLFVIHVALHWAWVCGTVQRLVRGDKPGAAKTTAAVRNLYGIGFLAVIGAALAGFLWIASANVVTHAGGGRHGGPASQPGGRHDEMHEQEEHGDPPGGRRQGRGWGSMTLADVEAATGVPVTVIREGLGLPDTVPPDERLGRLRHEYGFAMSAVRAIIERHQDKSNKATSAGQ